MDGKIDLTGQQCLFDFFDEQPLAADFREGDIENLVSRRVNSPQGHRDLWRKFFQPGLHPFALLHRQFTASRPKNNCGTHMARDGHISLSSSRLVIRSPKGRRPIRSR
jgi:hypothetical protein